MPFYGPRRDLFLRSARSILPTLRSANVERRVVYDRRTLLAALGEAMQGGIPAGSGSARWAPFDIEVRGVIDLPAVSATSGSSSLTAGLVLDPDLWGLTIFGARGAELRVEDAETALLVGGDYVTVSDVKLSIASGSSTPSIGISPAGQFFTAQRVSDETGASISLSVDHYSSASSQREGLLISDCDLGGIELQGSPNTTLNAAIVDSRVGYLAMSISATDDHDGLQVSDTSFSGSVNFRDCPDARVSGCHFGSALTISANGPRAISGQSIAGALFVSCDNAALTGNRIGGAVTITASSGQVAFVGNACGGGGVTSTGSGGSNTIVGNANAGTVTAHGSDSVANNT